MGKKFEDLKTTPKEVHKFNLFFYIPVLTLIYFISMIVSFVGGNVGGGILCLLFAALFGVAFCFGVFTDNQFVDDILMIAAHGVIVLFALVALVTGTGMEPISLAVSAYLVVYYAMRLAAPKNDRAEKKEEKQEAEVVEKNEENQETV